MAHETFGEEYQIVEAIHHLLLEDFRLDLSFQTVLVQLVARNALHFAHTLGKRVHRTVSVSAKILEDQQTLAEDVIVAQELFEKFFSYRQYFVAPALCD